MWWGLEFHHQFRGVGWGGVGRLVGDSFILHNHFLHARDTIVCGCFVILCFIALVLVRFVQVFVVLHGCFS